MAWLYILLGILLLIIFILLLRIRVSLSMQGEDIRLDVRVLCFRFRIFPRKTHVSVGKYSYKKQQKRLRKQEAKRQAAEKKAAEKKEKQAVAPRKKPSIKEQISLYTDIFRAVYRRFLHAFRIDIASLNITIATGDAAKTAILTGAVWQAVAYIGEILDQHTNLNRSYKKNIAVVPDFLGEKSRVNCRISFSLRVGQIISLGVRAVMRLLQHKMKQKNQQNTK